MLRSLRMLDPRPAQLTSRAGSGAGLLRLDALYHAEGRISRSRGSEQSSDSGNGSLPWNRGITGVCRGAPDRSLNACVSPSVRVRPRSRAPLPRRFRGDCPCGRQPVSPLKRRRCTVMPTEPPRTLDHRETLRRIRARQIARARRANAGARLDTRWSSHPAVAHSLNSAR